MPGRIKINERKDVYLFISDKGSAISFPTREGFDYTGFVHDGENPAWIMDLFENYWLPAAREMMKCVLCSSPIIQDPIIEVIDGKEQFFDSIECVTTYKRLKQIYGERFM